MLRLVVAVDVVAVFIVAVVVAVVDGAVVVILVFVVAVAVVEKHIDFKFWLLAYFLKLLNWAKFDKF